MNPLRLQMTRLHRHLICKIHLPIRRSPSNGHEGHFVEEAVVVGENEAFYLKGASRDYLGGRCLEETGTSVSALKVVNALTRKSVNRVKNTAIGHKVRRKNPENAGMIGKRNNPLANAMMKVLIMMSDFDPSLTKRLRKNYHF